MAEMTCDRFDQFGAELALGVLPGDQRTQALTHLHGCADCQRRMSESVAVADGLLALLPGAEPPAGFEERVLARLPAAPRPRPRRWWPSIAAAVAVAAVVFGAGGWALGTYTKPDVVAQATGQADDVLRRAVLVTTDHHEIGFAFNYVGVPSWLYMSVDSRQLSGTVYCLLQRADGTTVPVGSFSLLNGYGHWVAPTPGDPAGYVGARLVTADGAVIASGAFG